MIPFTIEQQLEHPDNALYLIEASAGTGKTYTIANLYLRHILAGRLVSQILVVTFTNAATDELRGRIREKLYSVLQGLEAGTESEDAFVAALLERYDSDTCKARLELAVRSMDEAAIFTIHGFCQRALKEFAFLSGKAFELEFNTNEDDLLLPIAKDWWRKNIFEADDLSYDVAKQAWASVDDFYWQIKQFLAREVKIIPEASSETIDINALFSNLQQAFEQNKLQLEEALIKHNSIFNQRKKYIKRKDIADSFAELEACLHNNDIAHIPDSIQAFQLSYLQSCLKKNQSLEDLDFFALCDDFVSQYQQYRQQLLSHLIRDAIQFFNQRGNEVKREQQILSFNDLLIQFNQALQSPTGEQLQSKLQQRYPIAMIDEFQDTDPVQYGIFKQLYVGQTGQTLYMIGDPKQAIYSFRGGDIYTYLQARQDVLDNKGTLYTLDTNWRSTPTMLKAVNTLFSRANQPFIYEQIGFEAVKTPPEKTDHKILTIDNQAVTALNFCLLDNDKKPLSKDAARKTIDLAVSQKIAQLIQLGKQGKARLGDKKLQANDIAVLVPSHSDAARLQQYLSQLGVNSVAVGKKTVFESSEADDLSILLKAVLKPNDRNSLRQALAVQILAYDYREMHRMLNSDADWLYWVDTFKMLHEQWLQNGFMAMFLTMLEKLNIADALAKKDNTDRAITNLLQLGELLQQASKEQAGMEALLVWFMEKRQNPSGEEAELRLESDDESVKLVTLHASKGLEYGVVFLPYLWDLKNIKKNQSPVIFHDKNYQLVADTGNEQIEQHSIQADYERLAEHTRLVYVALTRAVSCCYIAWGNIGNPSVGCADNSALGYLLQGKQTPETLQQQVVSSLGKTANRESIKAELADLLAASENTITVMDIETLVDNDEIARLEAEDTQELVYQTKHFNRSLDEHWRISSFSSLSRNIYHDAVPFQEPEQVDDILNFPAGKNTGLYLHSLFEYLDFQGDIASQVDEINQRLMPRYNLDIEKYNEITQKWAKEIIHTPLGDTGFCLADIPLNKRLNELEFHFSTQQEKLAIQALNQLLATQTNSELQPLNSQDFTGLVHGIIDLVFEHNGKYYLADYKSNYLGNTITDYQHDTMLNEIHKRRYDLQYTLYSIALHRYLASRLNDYNYTEHFGGIYYLFLRGMRSGETTGVYFTKPEESWLERVDGYFGRL